MLRLRYHLPPIKQMSHTILNILAILEWGKETPAAPTPGFELNELSHNVKLVDDTDQIFTPNHSCCSPFQHARSIYMHRRVGLFQRVCLNFDRSSEGKSFQTYLWTNHSAITINQMNLAAISWTLEGYFGIVLFSSLEICSVVDVALAPASKAHCSITTPCVNDPVPSKTTSTIIAQLDTNYYHNLDPALWLSAPLNTDSKKSDTLSDEGGGDEEIGWEKSVDIMIHTPHSCNEDDQVAGRTLVVGGDLSKGSTTMNQESTPQIHSFVMFFPFFPQSLYTRLGTYEVLV
ncbi:hypothetical protein DEU56DRAFT_757516 [Suillus clintonianus]|uniref:uncharacterized protein n=1 Tax=Suillus clintonianus TaxID=1904413 RepID=UPI001B883C21|nr:uncharacterized protein DEU56DRAFT_757516 [Suillus clintonianus]KAG2131625.1 hypothetical protein DEU56DRAFT_757516 [Suillus clintonianus]